MKRCYEQEWYEIATGCKENGNHCGDHVTINGVDYCPYDGKLKDYFGWCADIELPPHKKVMYVRNKATLEWQEAQGKCEKCGMSFIV